MSISVSQVRLVFNVDTISAVAVSSNWLYLTGGPSSIVRINLDSPSNVHDIHIPKKNAATAGHIKLLVASASGKRLFAVTSRFEHFCYSEEQSNKHEFKYLGKLKGTPTTCAAFYTKRRGCVLIGTRNGGIFEVSIDSSANETYFKRELKFVKQVWAAPVKEPVNSIIIENSHKQEVTASCGSRILKWRQLSQQSDHQMSNTQPSNQRSGPQRTGYGQNNSLSGGSQQNNTQHRDSHQSNTEVEPDDEGSVFRALFSSPPVTLISSDSEIGQLVISPDSKTLAATLGPHKVGFARNPQSSTQNWQEIDIASPIQYLLISNYYLLAVVSESRGSVVMAINLFDHNMVFCEPINDAQLIRGGAIDHRESTFWLFSVDTLLEIKLENELQGMWKVLADQHRFEEALDIANSRQSKTYILEKYGHYELTEMKNSEKAAKLLGMSDSPLERLALEIMQHDKSAVPQLLLARLAHTKSKAQQIMLTSWLAELDDFSFLDSTTTAYSVDHKTLQGILKEKGMFDKYLQVSTDAGDVEAVISYYISNDQWDEALDTLRQNEPQSEPIVYKYASVLLTKAPRQTVESWMRMAGLDTEKLLPSLITYSNQYRGPISENQALRYLTKHITTKKKQMQQEIQAKQRATPAELSVFNAIVTILSKFQQQQPNDEDRLLSFLKSHAGDYQDLDFALRMCLNYKQNQAAIYLYTLMGLYEDAVHLCLALGEPETYEQAVEIADKQAGVNEELRKYLLRIIAQRVIVTQGPQAASKFVGLLRVGDLLSHFPDFETLNELAPEIIKSLENMNSRLSTLNSEIDDSLLASESMQQELATFEKRSVLVEPGEECFLCHYPLITRKFVVFPCQHGFHVDCTQKKLDTEWPRLHRDVTDECVLCCKENIQQIDRPLDSDF